MKYPVAAIFSDIRFTIGLSCESTFFRSFASCAGQADVFFLKHARSILRQSSNPVCGSWKSQASSLWAKQHIAYPVLSWRNHIKGWKTVWICYWHAPQNRSLPIPCREEETRLFEFSLALVDGSPLLEQKRRGVAAAASSERADVAMGHDDVILPP